MTNFAMPPDILDAVMEIANDLFNADGLGDAETFSELRKRLERTLPTVAVPDALDAWPRGDLLRRVLTVECENCHGDGDLNIADATFIDCPTCHGRGRVLTFEVDALLKYAALQREPDGRDLQVLAKEYQAMVAGLWALMEDDDD